MFKYIWQASLWSLVLTSVVLAKELPAVEKTAALNEVNSEPKIYELTLRQAVELALSNNFDIQLAKYDTWIARTRKNQARSIYDTIFNSKAGYLDDQSQQVSLIAGTETTQNTYNFGFLKRLPTGTSVRTDLTNERTDTTSAFATSQLTHESTGKVTVLQELGRNFFGIQDRGLIKVTLKDIENAQFISIEKIEALAADVEAAYWDLVLSKERVRIEEDMVSQAQKLFDSQKQKFDQRLVEKPELIATEANLQRLRNDLLLAQNQVGRALNQFKYLLNLPESNLEINPAATFDLTGKDADLQPALKEAFSSRPDFLRAHNEIERQNIILSMSKNKLWPEINLTASLARNGLGGHFNDSITNISAEDNPELFAGLEFNFPLENNRARGEWSEAKLRKAKAIIALKLLERRIMIDIVDQLRDCQTLRNVAGNHDIIASLQAQKFSEEEIRFNQGRSDTDMLIRFQQDLIQSRLLAAEAKFQYHLALIELEQKKGTLLSQFWPDGVKF